MIWNKPLDFLQYLRADSFSELIPLILVLSVNSSQRVLWRFICHAAAGHTPPTMNNHPFFLIRTKLRFWKMNRILQLIEWYQYKNKVNIYFRLTSINVTLITFLNFVTLVIKQKIVYKKNKMRTFLIFHLKSLYKKYQAVISILQKLDNAALTYLIASNFTGLLHTTFSWRFSSFSSSTNLSPTFAYAG